MGLDSKVGLAFMLCCVSAPYVESLIKKLTSGQSSAAAEAARARQESIFHPANPTANAGLALEHLVAAFGPDGENARGTPAGCMVASPSKEGDGDSNNYWFQWPRDTGLCARSLVESFVRAENGRPLSGKYHASSTSLEDRIQAFVKMSLRLQHTANPSGTFEDGGLGEPKFNVDGSAFTGSWGRPQNDGPALRSITAAKYMRHVIAMQGGAGQPQSASIDFAKEHLWCADGSGAQAHKQLLIRDDLDYIARAWQTPTFELWEEVCADAGKAQGGHFHVLMTQRRALLEGVRLARTPGFEDEAAAARWGAAARDITLRLDKFWNPSGKLDLEGGPRAKDDVKWDDERCLGSIPKDVLYAPHIVPTLGRVSGQPKPTQADTAVLLAFTHAWDGSLGSSGDGSDGPDDAWQPWDDRCLATLHRLILTFAAVYPLNAGHTPRSGVLCGRYPEDVYDGVAQSIGNPWFLTTFAVPNVLYILAAHHAHSSAPVRVNSLNEGLFRLAWPALPHLPRESTQEEADEEADALALDADRTSHSPSPSPPASYLIHRGTPAWSHLLAGLRTMGDRYLTRVAEYAGGPTANPVGKSRRGEPEGPGRMSEQICRRSGTMRGARDLSWSYASLVAVLGAREL